MQARSWASTRGNVTKPAANTPAMTPYPGFKGRYVEMPCRNLVPKPYQRPHPPMWLACSRRETIHRAARLGLGALAFAFVEPEQAATWVQAYDAILQADQCRPLGHTVNPNVAVVSGFSLHHDSEEAIRRGLDGFRFFGYSLGHVAIFGQHRPGRTDVWQHFLEAKERIPDNAGRGGIGNPAQVRAHLERYERAGLDQVIFVQQCGRNRHEHICESLELFARDLHPAFQQRHEVRAWQKRAELAPSIEAALRRKRRLAPAAEAEIPTVEAFGRATEGSPQADPTRGGAIPVVTHDPRERL
jgi:alkanesulfonate monooxygenase SsuD/methylene tetrahydromethanopterin reductase-like flavin-dependent oxidoreductase (luciferase family)